MQRKGNVGQGDGYRDRRFTSKLVHGHTTIHSHPQEQLDGFRKDKFSSKTRMQRDRRVGANLVVGHSMIDTAQTAAKLHMYMAHRLWHLIPNAIKFLLEGFWVKCPVCENQISIYVCHIASQA